MPMYVYECECGASQEQYAHVSDRESKAPICHGRMSLVIQPTMVCADIEPYRAVAGDKAGQMISSRREHREFLKRNRFVEVGNEPVKPIKNDFRPGRGEIAQELKRVIPQVLKR